MAYLMVVKKWSAAILVAWLVSGLLFVHGVSAHYATHAQAKLRANELTASAGRTTSAAAALQLAALEQAVKKCESATPLPRRFRQRQYYRSWYSFLTKEDAERYVLDREEGCVTSVVKDAAMVNPEAAVAMALIAQAKGYQVSEHLLHIARNDPAALAAEATLF